MKKVQKGKRGGNVPFLKTKTKSFSIQKKNSGGKKK